MEERGDAQLQLALEVVVRIGDVEGSRVDECQSVEECGVRLDRRKDSLEGTLQWERGGAMSEGQTENGAESRGAPCR
jgi:hypothetical protein